MKLNFTKLTTIFLMSLISFTSCETDLQEPILEIKETKYKESVLLVNAIAGLDANEGIDVFRNGSKLNSTPVLYAETSPNYYDLNAGETSFEAKIGSTTIASMSQKIEAGKLYTIFLTGTKETPEILISEDDINLDDPNTKHSLSIANLSNEHEEGVELEIFIQGFDAIVDMGFHTATGPYGIMTVYGSVGNLPQVVKYKEVMHSSKFPASGLIVPFPYQFIKAGTNTVDKTISPIPMSNGTHVSGQSLSDLFSGNITNTVLFAADHHTTIVNTGSKESNDLVTFTYDNTDLYLKK